MCVLKKVNSHHFPSSSSSSSSSSFSILGVLGEGSYGHVYLLRSQERDLVALKVEKNVSIEEKEEEDDGRKRKKRRPASLLLEITALMKIQLLTSSSSFFPTLLFHQLYQVRRTALSICSLL